MDKKRDKVFKGEIISIDFSEYEHCLFENCEIHVSYGITRLENNDIRGCTLHLHPPASTVAEIIKMFSQKSTPKASGKKGNQ